LDEAKQTSHPLAAPGTEQSLDGLLGHSDSPCQTRHVNVLAFAVISGIGNGAARPPFGPGSSGIGLSKNPTSPIFFITNAFIVAAMRNLLLCVGSCVQTPMLLADRLLT
jgi:hypothetical protein